MNRDIETDLCVIGAGSAGLSVAAGAAQLGLKTVLIEAKRMGGDCLNTGCVPSKSLLAAAKLVHAQRHPWLEGLQPQAITIGRDTINRHIEDVIATIAPHDSVERFEQLGVTVIREHAAFVDEKRVRTLSATIKAKSFVVAAGSSAAIPPIDGLDKARTLTNETIFDLDTVPEHLIIIGGGPIGIEMAQAHRRIGSRVTVIDRKRILPKDDPELVDILRGKLAGAGIEIIENAEISSVAHGTTSHGVTLKTHEGERRIEGSHLLAAAGRRANVDGLNLGKAGIAFDAKGIKVDDRLRTTNGRVFAIGDIAGGPQFTHVAGYHAGIVIRNLVFRLPAKVDYSALPWVTYTDPELAHVGLTLNMARDEYGESVRSLTLPMKGLDRAVAEGRREGLIKIVAKPNGRILGCSILGPGAGELLGLWSLAITKKMSLRDLAGLILPYPTFSEISKQAASEWYKPSLFSNRMRKAVGWLQKLPRF